MQELSSAAKHTVEELAHRYELSPEAVRALLEAVASGGGTMAQFSHPDLGGHGQWMRGGMTMVADFGNRALKGKVDAVCSALSDLLAAQPVFSPSSAGAGKFGTSSPGSTLPGGSWWPSDLGVPTTAGGQNDSKYAYFPAVHRLAIRQGSAVTVYDTQDHAISGVQQQQGTGPGSVTFASQYGTFSVERLRQVPLDDVGAIQGESHQSSGPEDHPPPAAATGPAPTAGGNHTSHDVLTAIERLGELRQRGHLSEDEFQTKKRELLSRL